MLKLILCYVISWAIVVVTMPGFIKYLKKISFNQTVSEYSLKEYQEKASTPIMGGVLFIVVPVLDSEESYEPGENVRFRFAGSSAHVFDPETGKNLEW